MAHLRAVPQTSLYETTLENPEIEQALKARESAKDKAREARHNLKVLDDRAKGLIEVLELGDDAAVRIGDFVVSRKPVKGRSVSFETAPTTRLWIKALPPEA